MKWPANCAWCQKPVTEYETQDSYIPAENDLLSCEACGADSRIVDIKLNFSIVKDQSAEEKAQKQQEIVQNWKNKVAALRLKYPKASNSSLLCEIFGHKWHKLASSGHSTHETPIRGCLAVCVRCQNIWDNVFEEPDQWGFWAEHEDKWKRY
jgi:hypothetical protein